MPRDGLSHRFGQLGAFIGKYPRASVFISLALLIPSLVGLFLGLQLRVGLDEGFVPKNAPSRGEISAQKAFFGETDQSKEWYMALFGISRFPDGNMLQADHYEEFNSFYEEVTQRMVINGPRGNFTYAQICQPLCDINDQVQKLMDHAWLKVFGQVEMRYPVSRVLSYDVNIGKHVFNRTVDAEGKLVGARLVAFYFTSFIREGLREKELALFEEALMRKAEIHNALGEKRVQLIPHGSNIVTGEMKRGLADAGRNKLIGVLLCLGAFCVLHLFCGWLSAQCPWRRLSLALLSLPVPLLSLLASLGYVSALLRLPINLALFFCSPLLLLSVLSLAQGTFHLAYTWCHLLGESHRKQFSASERLAATFEQIGPSFLCTHLSAVFSFALLFVLLSPEHYCAWAATLALLHTHSLVLQVFLVAPLLSLLCHHPNDHFRRFMNGTSTIPDLDQNESTMKKPSIADHPPIVQLKAAKNGHDTGIPSGDQSKAAKKREQREAAKRCFRLSFSQKVIHPLGSFVSSSPGASLALIFSALLWWMSLSKGIPSLANSMDYRRLLPRGSSAQQGFDFMDTIWMDFFQILYIVRRPPDFENPDQFGKFKEFLTAVTALPQAFPPRAHQSWLFDYYRDQLDTELFQDDHSFDTVNMTRFGAFINGFPYRAWQSGVRYSLHEGGSASIDEMLVLVAYNGTRGLVGKRSLINECRSVAKQFPEFRVSVFDTDSRTVDIMNAVDPLVWRAVLAIVGSAMLVSSCVMCSVSCTLLYTVSSASIIINFFGFGQLLGLELDLLSAPTAIMVCSLSVQFGGHFVGEYFACWAKEDRVRHSLARSLPSITQSALLWMFAAVPPLAFSQVPFFLLQARLFLLGALLSLWHCVILLPALATVIPRGWTSH